jgi:hypothetical protein
MRARHAWLGALAAGLFTLAPQLAGAQEAGPVPFPAEGVPTVAAPGRASFAGEVRTAPSPVRFDAVYASVLDRVFDELRSLTELPPDTLSAIGQPAPLDLMISPKEPPPWVGPGVPPDARWSFHIDPIPITGQPVAYATPTPTANTGSFERWQELVLPSLVVPLPFLP